MAVESMEGNYHATRLEGGMFEYAAVRCIPVIIPMGLRQHHQSTNLMVDRNGSGPKPSLRRSPAGSEQTLVSHPAFGIDWWSTVLRYVTYFWL